MQKSTKYYMARAIHQMSGCARCANRLTCEKYSEPKEECYYGIISTFEKEKIIERLKDEEIFY